MAELKYEEIARVVVEALGKNKNVDVELFQKAGTWGAFAGIVTAALLTNPAGIIAGAIVFALVGLKTDEERRSKMNTCGRRICDRFPFLKDWTTAEIEGFISHASRDHVEALLLCIE